MAWLGLTSNPLFFLLSLAAALVVVGAADAEPEYLTQVSEWCFCGGTVLTFVSRAGFLTGMREGVLFPVWSPVRRIELFRHHRLRHFPSCRAMRNYPHNLGDGFGDWVRTTLLCVFHCMNLRAGQIRTRRITSRSIPPRLLFLSSSKPGQAQPSCVYSSVQLPANMNM